MRCGVAISTFNGGDYLWPQLESILNQTRSPDEIVISDDGSKDATMEIVSDFCRLATRRGISCKVFSRDEPLGITQNFEFACAQVESELIFLSDQDDIWNANKIERMLKQFCEEPEVMLINSEAVLIDDDGKPLGESLHGRLDLSQSEQKALELGDLSLIAVNRNLFTGATIAFRRSVMDVAAPFDKDLVHDDWISQMAWLCGEVRTIAEPLIEYRLHQGNAIGLQSRTEAVTRPKGFSDRHVKHLRQIEARLAPVVARVMAMPSNALLDQKRVQLRKKQLDLVRRRLNYSRHFTMRIFQVLQSLISGRYKVTSKPGRVAFLDIFRSSGSSTGIPG